MKRSQLIAISLVTLCFGLFLLPYSVEACSAAALTPAQLSMNAEIIVRATAVAYNKAPDEKYRITGLPDSTIEFRVEEILKGENVPDNLVINGYLRDQDDFNDRPVPYDFIRPGGRDGSCIANSYKEGTELLLFLKKKEHEFNPYWAALTPTNEQLRSRDDPWLKWVKDYLQSQRENGSKSNGAAGMLSHLIVDMTQWLRIPFAGAI
jgi:hypothetical protein